MIAQKFWRWRSGRATAFLLLAAALFLSPLAEAREPLTARSKKRIAKKTQRCLDKKAFVYGKDFTLWPGMLEAHRSELDASQTADELVAALNRSFAGFEVSHLKMLTPDELEARARGATSGAGLKAVPIVGGHLVTLVLPESPAHDAGLLRGDLITEIDGRSVAGGKIPGVIDRKLILSAGETRQVSWSRRGEAMTAEIGLGVHPSALPLALEWRAGDIAWLTLNTFRFDVYDRSAVEKAFAKIHERDARGLIIDVRSNGGGRLNNLLHMVSLLLPGDTVVGTKIERDDLGDVRNVPPGSSPPAAVGSKLKAHNRNGPPPPYEGPLVVLIDGSSGSGGDLFPAIMQDIRGATLVGSTTAGALIGGSWCKLPKGYALLYPFEEILRPNGTRVEGVGVSPDVELTPQQTADSAYIEKVALETLGR